MKIISSYGVEILRLHKPLKATVEIYRKAVGYVLSVLYWEWEELSGIMDTKKRFNRAEHLVHQTKENDAKYPFDKAFPKMPSYLRRSAIQQALGDIASYHTRQEMWEKCREGKPPVLSLGPCSMPVFYRDNMYREEGGETYLKLYQGKDWVWVQVKLSKTDREYLQKHWGGKKASAPVLEKRRKKYFLRFAYEETVCLPGKSPGEQVICGVDLGLNTDAVCSIMKADGTVAGRKFIGFPAEKDRLCHVLGRIRKKQGEQGPKSVCSLWKYACRLNDGIAKMTAKAIVSFAAEHQADVIVFEHLSMKGKKPGKNAQKLHLWKKNSIQEICMHQAHRRGMRISRVCAKNTSAYAFDGSGKVARDPENHSLCTFTGGKRYNCDLSASYNIGARYFIRELIKTFPVTGRSMPEAEDPAAWRRTSCVHADLIRLWEMISV